MTVSVKWDNDSRTIITVEFATHWTWDELYAALDEVNLMIDKLDYVVDVIEDWRLSPRLPVSAFAHARNLVRKMHPRLGTIIYVGMNAIVRALWNGAIKVYPHMLGERKFLMTETMDQARTLLTNAHPEQRDPVTI
jgi:hypothetical protein